MSNINALHQPTTDTQSEITLWETEFESVAGVSRIETENFFYLKQLLSFCDNQDSYATSANYYLFTGRNGLWIYECDDLFALICWHPNKAGKVLVFNPQGNSAINLLQELLDVMPQPPLGTTVARVGQDFEDLTIVPNDCQAETVKETILDWQYPIRILSTAKVKEMSGQKFMYIRNRIHQLRGLDIEIIKFDPILHSRAIENLIHEWCSSKATTKDEYENMYAPYASILEWSTDKNSGFDGIMIFVDKKLEAIGIWDTSNARTKIANVFVNLSNTAIKGLSELLITKCCETLSNQGIDLLNLGGSETPGLDHYKNKFRPEISLSLNSVEVTYNMWASTQHTLNVTAA